MGRVKQVAMIAAFSMLWVVGEAQAAKLDLSSVSSSTTGSQKISAEGLGSCSDFLSLDVNFKNRKKWSAVDNQGNKYSGKYKQSKKLGGRKITATFSGTSKRKLEKNLKGIVKSCAGAGKVSIDLKKISLKGTVNKARDSIRFKGKVTMEGEAGGEKGDATWKFETVGPLFLPEG